MILILTAITIGSFLDSGISKLELEDSILSTSSRRPTSSPKECSFQSSPLRKTTIKSKDGIKEEIILLLEKSILPGSIMKIKLTTHYASSITLITKTMRCTLHSPNLILTQGSLTLLIEPNMPYNQRKDILPKCNVFFYAVR